MPPNNNNNNAPGNEAPDTLQDALRALSTRAAADALEFTQRLKALRDQFDGTALAGSDSSAVSDTPRKQPGEVIYEAAKMHLLIANELMTFGQHQADFWLDRVQRMGVSMLPREQRPPVRLVCARPEGDSASLSWRLYVYNAAHEARAVSLTGRWRAREDIACALRFEGGESTVVVAPRSQKELVVEHDWGGALRVAGEYVAEVEVHMQGVAVSATPGMVVGRLELVANVRDL